MAGEDCKFKFVATYPFCILVRLGRKVDSSGIYQARCRIDERSEESRGHRVGTHAALVTAAGGAP